MPERWLRNDAGRAPPVNPYLVLPFGHGMRACIARRLAEQSMLVLVLNVSSRYKRYVFKEMKHYRLILFTDTVTIYYKLLFK